MVICDAEKCDTYDEVITLDYLGSTRTNDEAGLVAYVFPMQKRILFPTRFMAGLDFGGQG